MSLSRMELKAHTVLVRVLYDNHASNLHTIKVNYSADICSHNRPFLHNVKGRSTSRVKSSAEVLLVNRLEYRVGEDRWKGGNKEIRSLRLK